MGLVPEQCNLLSKKISISLSVSLPCTLCVTCQSRGRGTGSHAEERQLCRGTPGKGLRTRSQAAGGDWVMRFSPSTRELLQGPGTALESQGRAGRSGWAGGLLRALVAVTVGLGGVL